MLQEFTVPVAESQLQAAKRIDGYRRTVSSVRRFLNGNCTAMYILLYAATSKEQLQQAISQLPFFTPNHNTISQYKGR